MPSLDSEIWIELWCKDFLRTELSDSEWKSLTGNAFMHKYQTYFHINSKKSHRSHVFDISKHCNFVLFMQALKYGPQISKTCCGIFDVLSI